MTMPKKSKPKQTITLPCYDIKINLYEGESTAGTIESSLSQSDEPLALSIAYSTIEAFVLAMACAGVDVRSLAMIEAIETVVDKVTNEYSD